MSRARHHISFFVIVYLTFQTAYYLMESQPNCEIRVNSPETDCVTVVSPQNENPVKFVSETEKTVQISDKEDNELKKEQEHVNDKDVQEIKVEEENEMEEEEEEENENEEEEEEGEEEEEEENENEVEEEEEEEEEIGIQASEGWEIDDAEAILRMTLNTVQTQDIEDNSQDSEDDGNLIVDEKCNQLVKKIDSDEEIEELTQPIVLKTAHEIDPPPPEQIIEDIPEDEPVQLAGTVISLMNHMIIIQGSPGVPALEEGTTLCLENRKAIGKIDEIFGPVSLPRYIVRFVDTQPPETISTGTNAFFPSKRANFVLTQKLYIKGSDASNMYDEETAGDQLEFSDDEEERKAKKNKRKQIDQNPTSEEAASNDSNKPDTKERKKGKTRGRGRGRGNHVMHTNPYHTHTLSHMAFSQSMQSLNPNISPWMRQPVQGTQAQYPMAYSNPNFQPPSFSHNIDSPYSTVALIGTNQTRGGFSGFPNPTNP